MSTAAGRAWYARYRTTPRWHLLRAVARLLAAGRCRRCAVTGLPLEVHHRHYRTLGTWRELWALEALCRSCHRKVHGK